MRGAVQSTFSPSSLNTFEKCPKQYHFRYVLKLPVSSESIEAFVGKRVHEVLEKLYRFVGAHGKPPTFDQVQRRYRQNFDSQFDAAQVRIVRSENGRDYYLKNGARCLTNYYRRHYPFDGDETLGLERALRFELQGADAERVYALRGVIDRLVRARDGVLEIQDFKTGRYIPRQQELDRDRQLGLYEIGIRKHWGEDEPIRLVWHYLLSNQVRTSQRTPEQRAALGRETTQLIDRIRSEQVWAARPSRLCDWCEYREFCPAAGGETPLPARATAPTSETAPAANAAPAEGSGQSSLL